MMGYCTVQYCNRKKFDCAEKRDASFRGSKIVRLEIRQSGTRWKNCYGATGHRTVPSPPISFCFVYYSFEWVFFALKFHCCLPMYVGRRLPSENLSFVAGIFYFPIRIRSPLKHLCAYHTNLYRWVAKKLNFVARPFWLYLRRISDKVCPATMALSRHYHATQNSTGGSLKFRPSQIRHYTLATWHRNT